MPRKARCSSKVKFAVESSLLGELRVGQQSSNRKVVHGQDRAGCFADQINNGRNYTRAFTAVKEVQNATVYNYHEV